jgi:hypothetical protein
MSRLALAFIAGMATMYFLDPQQGRVRRQRWTDWWQHSRPVLLQTGQDIYTTGRQVVDAGRCVGGHVGRGTSYATSRVRAGLGR